jgi:hypothetical protein
MLLHGHYTPQPGGALTSEINAAEHFEKIKRSEMEVA